MVTGKILYTDRHDVTVTDSFFQVKKTSYQLNGITKHDFLILHPDRLPAAIMLVIGFMALTLGALHLIPQNSFPEVTFYSVEITANALSLGLGIVLLLAGSALMGLMKERYAVRIATAEGEKNVVISRSKEYVAQIVDALNKAFINFVSIRQKASRITKKI